MSQQRRLALKGVLASVLVSGAPRLLAQNGAFPDKAVSILVGAAAGGTSDNMTRVFARSMGERLGQSVIVENRPGAGSAVAAVAGARAAPDGYTLIMSSAGPMVLNKLLMKSLAYDPDNDFASVGTFARFQCVLVTHPKSRFRTLADVIDAARHDPTAVQYASGGALATPHLAVEMLQAHTGIKLTHVAYRGDAPAIADIMGGHVPLMTAGMPGVMALIRSGSLRPIAVFGQSRSPQFPDVPTAAESGVPELVVESWMALSAPAKTPKSRIARLNDALAWAAEQSDVKRDVRDLGAETYVGTPEDLDQRIAREKVVWERIIRSAKISAQ